MEGAAQRDQRLAALQILTPGRKIPLDPDDLFLGLLDEQLHELRIGTLLAQLHDGERVGPFLLVERCGDDRFRLIGDDGLRRRRHLFHRFGGLHALALDDAETSLGIVEHVPWIAPAGSDSLHVVLDAHDRIGEALELRRVQSGLTRRETCSDHAANTLDDSDRT